MPERPSPKPTHRQFSFVLLTVYLHLESEVASRPERVGGRDNPVENKCEIFGV